MGNKDDKMIQFSCMTSTTTFQDFLNIMVKFEKLNSFKLKGYIVKPRKNKHFDLRKNEAHTTSYNFHDKKRVYNDDKIKQLV